MSLVASFKWSSVIQHFRNGKNDMAGNAYFSNIEGSNLFIVKIIEDTLSIAWQKVISYTPGTHLMYPEYSVVLQNAYVVATRFYPHTNSGFEFTNDLDYLVFRIDSSGS